MINKIKKVFRSFRGNATNYAKLDFLYQKASDDQKSVKMNVAQLQAYFNSQKTSISNLNEVEFQVFSQGGEDGIIQYLISKVDIPHKTFVEFGVENYLESNTRFLFLNNGWSGLVMDGSGENIRFIDHNIASLGELSIKAAFITRDNINQLLEEAGYNSEIGILSIDIDGNDYWVWEAINVVRPVITIIEYNSVFGNNTYWTIPYDPEFIRTKKHWSQLFYGASLQALCKLGEIKGYTFIGCNSKGNNAFFVRKDKFNKCLPLMGVTQGYIKSKFSEARNKSGWISGDERIRAIEGMEVVDIRSDSLVQINSSFVKYD